MSRTIRIRKGADIRLQGRPAAQVVDAQRSAVYAIQPSDFHGVIPKMEARPGDRLQAGDVLFRDKEKPEVVYLSPVSGVLKEVVRGAKRRILAVEVEADATDTFRSFPTLDPQRASREEILAAVLQGGLFPFFEQRPFAVPANPADRPRAIYISGFSSAPLAPDMGTVLAGRMEDFQAGVWALGKLAGEGGVHLGVRPGDSVYAGVKGVEVTAFEGPHPAGNVGVQIHWTHPVNKGEVVWTMHPEDIVALGHLLTHGHYRMDRVVAAGGSEHPSPQHYRVRMGSRADVLMGGAAYSDRVRVVSGDVLSGTQVQAGGYLGAKHHQLAMLPEGRDPKFLLTEGWLSPGLNKFSLSRAFPTWLLPKSKEFALDTNNNGEHRAFVVSGQYEAVFPFDILPVHLVKSILANDIDGMERLGIYEVAPEDFALCEFSCTSKMELQHIVREGLDLLQNELG
jgi:Na+-transporting NADH:ubiquinone oxidoreductase subunit A